MEEFDFETLVENVKDAIIKWEEPEICDVAAMFLRNEEAKMEYLTAMVGFFEGK